MRSYRRSSASNSASVIAHDRGAGAAAGGTPSAASDERDGGGAVGGCRRSHHRLAPTSRSCRPRTRLPIQRHVIPPASPPLAARAGPTGLAAPSAPRGAASSANVVIAAERRPADGVGIVSRALRLHSLDAAIKLCGHGVLPGPEWGGRASRVPRRRPPLSVPPASAGGPRPRASRACAGPTLYCPPGRGGTPRAARPVGSPASARLMGRRAPGRAPPRGGAHRPAPRASHVAESRTPPVGGQRRRQQRYLILPSAGGTAPGFV